MRHDRLDGVAYVGQEEAADAMRQIETLIADCHGGEALLSKVRSSVCYAIFPRPHRCRRADDLV